MSGATYDRIHRDLIAARGSAVGLPCSHPTCEDPSTGWALLGHPTHLGVDSHGKSVRWSIHLMTDYGPACHRHNAQRDHGGNWTFCPHGHVRAAWGTDKRGTCRGCVRHRRKTSRRTARLTPTPGTNNNEGAPS